MPATTRPGPRTPVWADLSAHATRLAAVPVQELFERDPGRFERLSREQTGLLMDFSRQRLDEIALAKLFQLADASGLRARIDAMWQGEHIKRFRRSRRVACGVAAAARCRGRRRGIEQAVMAERARMFSFARACARGPSGAAPAGPSAR